MVGGPNIHNKNAAKMQAMRLAKQISEAFGFPRAATEVLGPDETHDYVIVHNVAPTREQAKKGVDVISVTVSRTREGIGFYHDGKNLISIEAIKDGMVQLGGALSEGVARSTSPTVGEGTIRRIMKLKPDWFRRCKPTVTVRGKPKTIVFY